MNFTSTEEGGQPESSGSNHTFAPDTTCTYKGFTSPFIPIHKVYKAQVYTSTSSLVRIVHVLLIPYAILKPITMPSYTYIQIALKK